MRFARRAADAFKFAPGEFVSAAPAIAPDEGTGRIFGRLWHWGGLSFGNFSLATQRKDSRQQRRNTILWCTANNPVHTPISANPNTTGVQCSGSYQNSNQIPKPPYNRPNHQQINRHRRVTCMRPLSRCNLSESAESGTISLCKHPTNSSKSSRPTRD
jgi:hypothetical protein